MCFSNCLRPWTNSYSKCNNKTWQFSMLHTPYTLWCTLGVGIISCMVHCGCEALLHQEWKGRMLGDEFLLFQNSFLGRETFAGNDSQQLFPLLFFSLLCSKASGVIGLTALFCSTGIFIYCITILLPDVLVPVLKTKVITNSLICISEQKHTTCNVFSICHTFNM